MTDDADAAPEIRRAKYGRLPPLVPVEDMTTTQDAEPIQDPDGGRDVNREFMIRHAGG